MAVSMNWGVLSGGCPYRPIPTGVEPLSFGLPNMVISKAARIRALLISTGPLYSIRNVSRLGRWCNAGVLEPRRMILRIAELSEFSRAGAVPTR